MNYHTKQLLRAGRCLLKNGYEIYSTYSKINFAVKVLIGVAFIL